MTITINPVTYVTREKMIPWQVHLGAICTDLSHIAGVIDDASSLGQISTSQDAERDARLVADAARVLVDAMTTYEQRYVRGE